MHEMAVGPITTASRTFRAIESSFVLNIGLVFVTDSPSGSESKSSQT